jgi:cyclophilin family peptidyl-prolyl cis-trans isomerase
MWIKLGRNVLVIGLVIVAGCSTVDTSAKKVKLETTMGDIVIELNEEAAPITVANFVRYVNEGFYHGTIFHRVKPDNPLKNDRGTIAMARQNNPDSATSQFFINHKNNDYLNYIANRKPGYAVFGKVINGMDVVDKIAAVKTTTKMRMIRGRRRPMEDIPVERVVIKSAGVVGDK